MKQFLLTAAFTATGFIALNAQSSEIYDDISFVPASLTSDGKAYILGLDNEETSVTIMDGDLNVVKQINLQSVPYIHRTYTEIAHAKYDPYDPLSQAAIENAEWVIESGSEKSDNSSSTGKWFEVNNWDSGELYGGYLRIILSQTLFNEDDKWEYVLPKYGKKIIYGSITIVHENQEDITLYRPVNEYSKTIGFGIYNEDGIEIGSILGEFEYAGTYINIIDGNVYMNGEVRSGNSIAQILYKYDRATTSVQEVLRTKGKSASISVNGRSITVDAANQNVDEAVVYDMSGRPMVSAKGRNRITLNASQLPEGLYSVATRNNGKTNGAQKIVIK